ncbi:uncharacterized protein LOC119452331 [Dermacentor silvarum]|uniref:uncharacterized protein LOC119452331 n=1 Tax=Dermacentor silvarum TaxID=543639 RepID=UPI001897E866|nr:uncharacterized protein LOC119452331 [Dermacentor silvarum]
MASRTYWKIAAGGIGVLFIVILQCFIADPVRPGDWRRHSVDENPLFEELAHFAISRQVRDREYFDTVLELVDVESQGDATIYRIKFKTTESTCGITETYSKRLCLPRSRGVIKDTCTAVFFIFPWLNNERSLYSFSCEGNSVSA